MNRSLLIAVLVGFTLGTTVVTAPVYAQVLEEPDTNSTGNNPSEEYPFPIIENVIVDGNSVFLEWSIPPSPNGNPEGGFDVIIDGQDTNGEHRTQGFDVTIEEISDGSHCFAIQARWMESSILKNSEEICVEIPNEPLPEGFEGVLLNLQNQIDELAEAIQSTFEDLQSQISELNNSLTENVEALQSQITSNQEAINDLEEKVMEDNQGKIAPILFSNTLAEPGNTNYGGSVSSQSTHISEVIFPISGNVSKLTASATTENGPQTPGEGNSYTITLLKDNQTSGLSCTIENDETSCQDENNSVPVEKFSRGVIVVTTSETATSATIHSSLAFLGNP